MRIIVLSGSPKGDLSVTVQYVRYLQKAFPEHSFEIVQVSPRIKRLEEDARLFDAVLDQMAGADLLLWATPVYYMLVPAQFKRFVELLFERGAAEKLAGKYAAALTTSIHFFDHIAHEYLHAVSEDLGMRFTASYSADSSDLLKPEERARLRAFGRDLFATVEARQPVPRAFWPLVHPAFDYAPAFDREAARIEGKRILILTDAAPGDTTLHGMVDRFQAALQGDVRVVNLWDVDISRGCIGCLQCGWDNTCPYADDDGYQAFFNGQVLPADVLVWAGRITDRYLSARWKYFFDRSFFLGHTTPLAGKQVALLIAGPYGQAATLRAALEGYFDLQHANLVGVVTDEAAGAAGDSAALDALIDALAVRIARATAEQYVPPHMFPAVAARRLFRDEVWGRLRLVFRADHLTYRATGWYNFPQRHWKQRAQSAAIRTLLHIPRVRREFYGHLPANMVQPYRKVVAGTK